MKIRFHGACQTVTGSLHIIETARGETVFLDCGLFQGRRQEARERNMKFPVMAHKVDAVVLSHAHMDHVGNLPTWVSKGLKCPVIGTKATVELAAMMMMDSAKIQEHDAAYLNKKHPGAEKIEPMYRTEHAEAAAKLLGGVAYREWFEVRPGLRAMYHDAGHILGSASITLEENFNGSTKRIVFTGDVGRPDTPILRDPEPPPSGADVVISESTYGDRDHAPVEETEDKLQAVFERTFKRMGRVIIPAFALGRTQSLMVALRNLQQAGRLPHVPVYVDSPLACNATDIFARHPECYDKESMEIIKRDGSLFALDGYACLREASDSKALNHKREPSIIIAASGMCEAGRILHHLENNMEDERNTILIVGYQAENTLGKKLVDGWKTVRVYGMERHVRAEVVVLNGMSAHAGQAELSNYLNGCRPHGPVFLVHGDPARQQVFKAHLTSKGYPDIRMPVAGDTFQV